jgi:hypothetical protein
MTDSARLVVANVPVAAHQRLGLVGTWTVPFRPSRTCIQIIRIDPITCGERRYILTPQIQHPARFFLSTPIRQCIHASSTNTSFSGALTRAGRDSKNTECAPGAINGLGASRILPLRGDRKK